MKNRKQGFTLVEIMIVVMIIGLLAAIALPGFKKAREQAQENSCINNMRQIDAAKDQYAIEAGLTDGDDPGDYAEYLKGGTVPTCPIGDTAYTVGAVGTSPTCTNGHVLPNAE